jgi:hypothetical protein
MGLGRTTRFAPTPAGARRVSVMRAGRAGLKELAPPSDLFADFQREKAALRKTGRDAGQIHRETFANVGYRARYLQAIRASPEAMRALRALVEEARSGNVYLMCMCPYRTPGDACHTYLLLELARELDGDLTLLPEPRPRPRDSSRRRSS